MWVPGHQVLCKVNGEETGGAYSLLEVLRTGEGPPQHIHKAGDEAFYVLAISPPGFEEYFIETGDAVKEPNNNAYIEKAMAVADKYNLEIVGPPMG